MRKFLLSTLGLFFSIIAFSQLKFKGTIIKGPTAGTVDILISPNIDFTGYLTNVVFTLEIPQGVTQPATITTTPLSTYFPTFNTFGPATTTESDGTYINYGYSAVNTSISTNTTILAGTDYPVLRLTFGGSIPSSVKIANLADGGPGTLYQFYVEGNSTTLGANDFTNYVQMFYGPVISPTTPYPDEATGYSSYQYVTLTSVVPVKLTNFSAVKKNNDAVLNWQVSNQDANSSYFELQRSFNGTDFKKVGRVDVNLGSGLAGSYAFTDVNATALRSNVLYYRLKMVDKDDKATYSAIKNIRLTSKAFGVNVYPNPARQFSTVNIDLENESTIILSLTDASGKLLQKTQFNGFKGLNQKQIDLSKFASGSYLLKVNSGNEIQTLSIIKE